MHLTLRAKFFPLKLVAMTVSLLTLPPKFLKQSAPSVMIYLANPIKRSAVAKSSVKHVSNQSKHKQSHVRCVNTQVLLHFMTRSYSELSINYKFDVHSKKEAAPGQENWENLTPTLTAMISPVPVSMLTFTVSLVALAVQL